MDTNPPIEDSIKVDNRELSRWVTRAAVFCAVLIGVGMFAISFTALRDLAIRSGISPALGWVWAVCIDGIIAASTLALVALAKHPKRAKALPWILIMTGGAVSVAGNIFDAQIHAEPGFATTMVVVIAAAPPLGLLSLTQLVVVLSRRTSDNGPALPVSGTARPGARNTVADPSSALRTDAPFVFDENPRRPSSEPRLSPAGGYESAKEWVLQQFSNGVDITGTDVADRFGCASSTARRWLRKIREEHTGSIQKSPDSVNQLRAVGS